MAEAQVLIAGAGPTGLAAALFLTDLGVACRIVDPAPQGTQTSKALVVNPRSQELLEGSGVTAMMQARGRPIRGMQVRLGGGGFTLPIAQVHPRFTMLALEQSKTEAVLAEALAARGIAVERDVGLEAFTQTADHVTATLKGPEDRRETLDAPILFAADGAHSPTRHALGLSFDGDAEAGGLLLADVTFTAPVTSTEGYVQFLPDHGFVFALALQPDRWRLIGDGERMYDHLPPGAAIAKVNWNSAFKISHRIAARLNVGRVCLAGDAAHIHSPVGGRGMNLGIEDAWVFAHCARDFLAGGAGRLDDYGRLRHAVDGELVNRIRTFTRVVLGRGPLGAFRTVLPRLIPLLPPVRMAMMRMVAGLDHPVHLA